MNKELLLKIAHRLETEPTAYDQELWLAPAETQCGSVACIAGHAVLEHYERPIMLAVDGGSWFFEDEHPGSAVSIKSTARRLLELTDWEAMLLFDGTMMPTKYTEDQWVDMDHDEQAGAVAELLREIANGRDIEEALTNE